MYPNNANNANLADAGSIPNTRFRRRAEFTMTSASQWRGESGRAMP
jgi:hypothetical protein